MQTKIRKSSHRESQAKPTAIRQPQDDYRPAPWENQVLFFSGLFFIGAFIRYFFGYSAKWLGALLDFVSPVGVLGLGFVFLVRGLRALVRKKLFFNGHTYTGLQAQGAGVLLLFACGIFLWLGIRTLIWFVK